MLRSSSHGRGASLAQVLLVLGLALSTAALGGCAALGAAHAPTLTPLPTEQPAPTETPLPTATYTPVPSATPLPTATATPLPSPTPLPLEVDVALQPGHVLQGQTVLLRVRVSRAAEVTAEVGGTPVRCVSADGLEHLGLVGISAVAESARLPVLVRIVAAGQTTFVRTTLDVAPGSFESEVLAFVPEVDALLAPEITQPEAERLAKVYATFSPAILWDGPFAWPLESVRVTSAFGTRRQYGDRPATSYHAGIDLGGETGLPVHAAADGVVVLADTLQVRGNAVILDHGAGVLTGYYHLDAIQVTEGQTVSSGDVVGLLGATGLATGSHLHWEVRVGGTAVDPVPWAEGQVDTAQGEWPLETMGGQ